MTDLERSSTDIFLETLTHLFELRNSLVLCSAACGTSIYAVAEMEALTPLASIFDNLISCLLTQEVSY
jgi:hypothetical protein